MGLDISYYSNIKESEVFDEDSEITIYSQTFTYQLGSLKQNTSYEPIDGSHLGRFRAGSYSGYNTWRNQLAEMAGYGSAENVWRDFKPNIRYYKLKKLNGEIVDIKPFYELIFFSDCEGFIGPEISSKLYKDFINFDKQAKWYSQISENDYFYTKYEEWTECFRVASQHGIVMFC